MRTFLADLRDEDLDRVVEFALGSGQRHAMRLGELMHHAAIHGVHHRGQVALLLRSLGQAPGNFDILFYYRRPKRSTNTVENDQRRRGDRPFKLLTARGPPVSIVWPRPARMTVGKLPVKACAWKRRGAHLGV